MSEGRQDRFKPLREDGVWRQHEHVSNLFDDDGLLNYEAFAVKRDSGAWFISKGYGDGESGWVPVREDIARAIVLGIEAERRMKERKPQWEADSSLPDIDEEYVIDRATYANKVGSLALPKKYREFYCHAVIQQLLNMPREGSDRDEVYRSIEGFDFQFANSYEDLVAMLKDIDLPAIGRIAILEAQNHTDLDRLSDVHSFLILGQDAAGNYLCFEKSDSFENPIRLNTLTHIYEHHQENNYAFQSFEAVELQVRKRLLHRAGPDS